jgi:hypothetical protein
VAKDIARGKSGDDDEIRNGKVRTKRLPDVSGPRSRKELLQASGKLLELLLHGSVRSLKDAVGALSSESAPCGSVGPERTIMSDDKLEKRLEFIAGLRRMADFFETHPSVEVPYSETMNVFIDTKEELADIARTSTWEKKQTDNYFWLEKNFGGRVQLQMNIERGKVCRKVVTGTKVLPAREAQEVEIFEWVCEEPLLKAEGGD